MFLSLSRHPFIFVHVVVEAKSLLSSRRLTGKLLLTVNQSQSIRQLVTGGWIVVPTTGFETIKLSGLNPGRKGGY